MRTTWLRAAALLLTLFFAGGAIGYEFAVRRQLPAMPAASMDPATVVRTLTSRLNLSPTQADSVGAILRRRQAAIDAAWATLRPGVRTAMDSAEMDIVGVLRPDQRDRFLALMRVSHPGLSGPAR